MFSPFLAALSPLFSFLKKCWNNRIFRFWAPPIFIARCFYLGLLGPMEWFSNSNSASIRVDADTSLLADALKSHPNLSQTWNWWTGPWYEAVPYFRPLTMMGFWAQYKIFGEDNLLAFEGLHWFYHGLALVILYGFFAQIAGRGRAALAVGMFAAGANERFFQLTGLDAFNCWKDSADVWHLSFFTLSAWAFLSFLRSEKRRFYALSLGLWICAVAVKESGYVLPFLLPVLLWHEKKLRSHWRWAVPFFAIAPLLWAYRWNALGGWGNRFGSNGSWRHRVAVDAFGFSGHVVNGDTLGLMVIVSALILVWVWRVRECGERQRVWPFVLLSAALVIASWQAMRFSEHNLFDTVALLMFPQTWPVIKWTALLLALYLQCGLRRDRAQLFAVGWIAVTFIPLAMQPPTSSHAHYPVAPGWSLFLACAIWALPASLVALGRWLQPVPRQGLASSKAVAPRAL